MKSLQILWLLVSLSLISACGPSTLQQRQDSNLMERTKTDQSAQPSNSGKKAHQTALYTESYIDSLRIDSSYKHALAIVRRAFEQNYFSQKYEFQPDDSSYTIPTDILLGNLFDDSQKYFLLRRDIIGVIHLDLHKLTG